MGKQDTSRGFAGITLVSSTKTEGFHVKKAIRQKTPLGLTKVKIVLPVDLFERPFRWQIKIWARTADLEQSKYETELEVKSPSTITELEPAIEELLMELLLEAKEVVEYGYNATIVK